MNDAVSTQALIEARDLTRIYGASTTTASQVVVFENLNFAIERGKLVALIGPSGAGKSTLLHLLGGLDRPTRGSVIFDNADVSALNARELARFRNRHIGFVFQFHHLLPEFTVLENAMMPGIIRGAPKAELEAAAGKMLERVGLGPRMTHQVGEISGGEQQRVAIARALIGGSDGGPRLLLADEPTGNLDQKTGEAVFSMIRELHQEKGLTSVIVTHNERLAAQCDEVWEMGNTNLPLSTSGASIKIRPPYV
jgi:lipoprotein-releasing system ATP-binding protein